MEKRTILNKALCALVALIGSLTLCGCSQNDGYIGEYFGSWVFDEITVDGEPEAGYEGNLMISFQSSLFQMDLVVDVLEVDDEGKYVNNGGEMIMGIWKEEGRTLTFSVYPKQCNHKITNKDGKPVPAFPDMSGFGSGTDDNLTVTLTIEKKTSDRMVWTRTDAGGRLWRYTLRHLI